LQNSFEGIFAKYQASQLWERVPNILEDFMHETQRKMGDAIETLHGRELKNAFTINEEDMSRETTRAREVLYGRRKTVLEEQAAERRQMAGVRNSNPSGKLRVDNIIEHDRFTREIDAMAAAAAYYTIARKRFIDYIVIVIQCDVFKNFPFDMSDSLNTALGVKESDGKFFYASYSNDNDICSHLLIHV